MSSRCVSPITLKSGFHVPCGKCQGCVVRRASGWSFRLMREERFARSAQFITLTYAPENVCRSPVGRRLTLVKSHVQCFVKKLRRLSDRPGDIKYYAVGEYGTTFSRPHYHIVLFNSTPQDVSHSWQYGSVYYGTVTSDSVGYCLKYMSKERTIPQYKADDRTPEFGLFSKGLGSNYVTPETIAWHRDDLLGRMYIPIDGGKKIAMPRYYKDLIYTKAQRILFQGLWDTQDRLVNKTSYQSNLPYIRFSSFKRLRTVEMGQIAARNKMRASFFLSRTSAF
ncbi:MAG: replication initiator protein [Microvirus sp.]|nr:MAG: replication initiator protein [Microvirus sp.]